jgi:hypothetical protein
LGVACAGSANRVTPYALFRRIAQRKGFRGAFGANGPNSFATLQFFMVGTRIAYVMGMATQYTLRVEGDTAILTANGVTVRFPAADASVEYVRVLVEILTGEVEP